MIEFNINRNQAGQRLDRFLRKTFPDTSLSKIFALLRKKKVKVNGKRGKNSAILLEGDKLKIFEDLTLPKVKHFNKVDNGFFRKNFVVLFENDDLLVLDKPSGIAAHQGSAQQPGKSLVELLWHYLPPERNENYKATFAHRLDKGTSGLIVAAKNAAALRAVALILKQKEAKKEYLCLVKGTPRKKSDLIDLPLQRIDSKTGGTKMLAGNGINSRNSYTEYEVAETFRDCSLLKVILHTGRTHQIRAHLSIIGHPLACDKQYGDSKWDVILKREYSLNRIFLHSYSLTFNKEMSIIKREKFVSPLPKELDYVLIKLRS